MSNGCCCGKIVYNLIFGCSGASDLGEISDKTARKLMRKKLGYMSCVAAIAADIDDIVLKTKEAAKIIAIDGCDKACAKKILEKSGFKNYQYLCLTDLGMEKGKTPPTDENIQKALSAAEKLF